jgi:hypothetical protein
VPTRRVVLISSNAEVDRWSRWYNGTILSESGETIYVGYGKRGDLHTNHINESRYNKEFPPGGVVVLESVDRKRYGGTFPEEYRVWRKVTDK